MFVHRAAIVVVIATFSGCFVNQTGRTTAARHGDLPHETAPRTKFDAELTEACGHERKTRSAMLPRHPYLQQLTDRSVTLMWTAKTDAPMTLTVRRAVDAQLVREVTSTLDRSAPPTERTFQHVASLDALEPGTIYCWNLSAGPRTLIRDAGFRTAPARGEREAVRFVVVGDMGSGSPDQYAVRDQMQKVPFDLMLTVGDNAYDHGTLAEYERNFFDVYHPVLRAKPVFPTSGNHDYRTDQAGPFREVFALPENGSPVGRERWYSYDFGDVHFVALDTELVGSVQAEWLERDLSANRLPWVIVYAHKPPYSSGEHGSNRDVREVFGPIFARHRVPLVLSGHDHHYERTKPVDGTTYVVTGGGGRSTRRAGSSKFTAFSAEVLHFVWVEVSGGVMSLHAIDASGQEFDSFRMVQQ